MPRCDISMNVVSLVSENYKIVFKNYKTHTKRMELSNLHQILYHIQAQALTCVYENEKPTVACRPLGFVVNLISKQPKLDSKMSHLSTTPHLKRNLKRRQLYE